MKPSWRWLLTVFDLSLLALVLIGIGYRFYRTNWSQGTNLHPDEYGLTNTLTQLSLPHSAGEYFNTRLSPLSPYQKYDLQGNPTQPGPDNRLRWGQWPIILLRSAGEWSGNTGYDEIRLMGRQLSAAADSLSIFLLFLTGARLYSRRVGLLAAALSALAVMQIQQSHFMTVDNFAVLFTMISLYAAVRLAGLPCVFRRESQDAPPASTVSEPYRVHPGAWVWYILFGVGFGMAMASRINLLPLAGIVLLAALLSIADLKLRSRRDLLRILIVTGLHLILAALVSLVVFRVCQPMTFRAAQGDTGFFTVQLNPDWVESMKVAQNESQGIGGGPPSEQWANRPALLFPWTNMVLWGMGLPLGLSAWLGFLWAGWRVVRGGSEWRAHILPLIWVGGYFLFMGTRWVKSIRYFLPIYPFLCLLAAWALVAWWNHFSSRATRGGQTRWIGVFRQAWLPGAVIAFVLFGTLAWANAFVTAVYRTDHTRIQATRWIWENIPASFHLTLGSGGASHSIPIPAHDQLVITPELPFVQPFLAEESGTLEILRVPHAAGRVPSGETAGLRVVVAQDPDGNEIIGEVVLEALSMEETEDGEMLEGKFTGGNLIQGQTYYLVASVIEDTRVKIRQAVVSNESWDEGLPVPLEGKYVFGSQYQGLTMEVRWYDDEHKRQMFLETLDQVDYIILPSQRAIWSASRIPLTYPMTLIYYQALFDGSLGFDLAAEFQSPFALGPLQISDVGGTLAWGQKPNLPLFNSSPLAAEEAFSVYDHPPVWIFKKRADFDLQTARAVLDSVDLSQVVIQSPREASQ